MMLPSRVNSLFSLHNNSTLALFVAESNPKEVIDTKFVLFSVPWQNRTAVSSSTENKAIISSILGIQRVVGVYKALK